LKRETGVKLGLAILIDVILMSWLLLERGPFLAYLYVNDPFMSMARPLRIEYPEAWYHVMNRGGRGEDIFSEELPSSRELLPGKKRIIDEVCRYYGVKPTNMIKKQRGKRNEARNVAIYLTRKLRLDTYKEIGEQYGIDNDRTIRSVFVRMKKTLTDNRDIASNMDKLQVLIQRIKNG
jgi:DnaA-like protein